MASQMSTDERRVLDDLAPFAAKEVLAFGDGGRHAVVLGDVRGDPALVQLTQRAEYDTKEALVAALPSLKLALTNYSGAEYSYYDAAAPSGAAFACEAIWPASERQVQRKRPAELVVYEETGEAYDRLVKPFAAAQAAKIGWIDAGAPWTADLYLLAIAKDAAYASIRDLRGERGAGLVRAMRDALLAAARDYYGVPPSKLRVFFHYQPQFYRLHAHCTAAQHVTPGCECDRAHLLTTVAENLDLAPDYYARATLTYKLRVGEKLHGILVEGLKGLFS
ncbi:m7G(5')pppN diphosphatase [Aureococcus anophagefferens]|nr:m7G(5')pppN diphosphatase [Aureococcus anophagefferens]